jgi:hypothetical protein
MFLFLLWVARSLILSLSYSIFLFLKSLLASRLTLFRLYPCICLGSCNQCNWNCFHDLIVPNIIFCRTNVFAASVCNNINSLWLKIWTWYRSLPSNVFSFLRLNLPTWNFYVARLLTGSLSLTFATTKYWSVSQSAALKDRTSSTLERSLLSIKMSITVHLIACLSIRRRQSKFRNVAMWVRCSLDNSNFRCGKVYCSNSITITNFV